jgi:hypothetical protein
MIPAEGAFDYPVDCLIKATQAPMSPVTPLHAAFNDISGYPVCWIIRAMG